MGHERRVQLRPALADGNCFYSALYRALQERSRLLQKLATCARLDTRSECAFIASYRARLADRVAEGDLLADRKGARLLRDMYTYFTELAKEPASYRLVMQYYPRWFAEEFGAEGKRLGTRTSFCKRLAAHIRTDGEWVGEIEVRMVSADLQKCGILLEVHKAYKTSLESHKAGKPVVHLYNPADVHCEYFSFGTAAERSHTRKQESKGKRKGVCRGTRRCH